MTTVKTMIERKNPTPGQARRARRPVLLAVAGIAAVVLGSAGCGHPEEPGHAARPEVVRAPAATAELVEVPLAVDLFGTVEAERTAAVSARVMAMVTAVEVRAGERVARGQSLLEIDPQAAEGQLAQARGALAQARAALALAARNRERFEVLGESDAASRLELDTARMHHEQALGAVEQAEGAVRSAAAVAADARVRAPFAGRVVRRMVEVGDLAAPGRPLLMLESERGRRLVVEVPESVAARADLELGRKVEVVIDAHPDLGRFAGEIVETTPGVDPGSHTLTVKIALPHDELPSGSAGRARVVTGTSRAVAIPAAAVIERGGLSLVIVVTPEGEAASRVVTLGGELPATAAGPRVEVLSGLAGGERVLLGLALPVPIGTRVEITQ